MHLKSIKLVGFKSFADATTIDLSGRLIGVVGPNGCGKSNVIDAVRWVLGESSAKFLRSETGADVVFNGSASRKPAGFATVELIFDNTDGRIGGKYQPCAEVSVQREINREGESRYYLNHVLCRRKDVSELFLGTGLGPRSYAIIEQNTISRMIEAKPEVLRTYLEEAAGLSHYKENRKETESKIDRTKQNLARVDDVRRELDQQIQNLEQQAKVAEEYRGLKSEERLMQRTLYVKRWQRLSNQHAESEKTLERQQTEFMDQSHAIQNLDSELEQVHQSSVQKQTELNQVQAEYYQFSSEMARIEQEIRHQDQKHGSLESRIKEIERRSEESFQQFQVTQEETKRIEEQVQQLQPQLVEARQKLEQTTQQMGELEREDERLERVWSEQTRAVLQATDQVRQQELKLQNFRNRSTQLQIRIEQLQEELKQLDVSGIPEEIARLEAELQVEKEKQDKLQVAINQQFTQTEQLKQTISEYQAKEKILGQEIDEAKKQYLILHAIQQAEMGEQAEGVKEWLKSKNWHQLPKLLELVQVETGYELAVERVLLDLLSAICLNSAEELAEINNFSDVVKHGELAFVVRQPTKELPTPVNGRTLLLSKLQSKEDLRGLLAGVYSVDTLEEALALQKTLSASESVVTKNGIWLGNSWGRVRKAKLASETMIAREKRLKVKADFLAEKQKELATQRSAREAAEKSQTDCQFEYKQLQEQFIQLRVKNSEIEAERKAKQLTWQQMVERGQRITVSLDEAKVLHTQSITELEGATKALEQALVQKTEAEQSGAQFQTNREQAKLHVKECQSQLQVVRNRVNQLTMQAEMLSMQKRQTETNAERFQKTKTDLTGDQAAIAQELKRCIEERTALKEHEQTKRQEQSGIEERLKAVQEQLAELEQALKSKRGVRAEHENALQTLRAALEKKQLACQEIKVRLESLKEQATLLEIELESAPELPTDVDEGELERRVRKIKARLDQLGPVNLMAVEEYSKQAERKVFLDKQYEDLQNALATLEKAIQEIDEDTKVRFQTTFDAVNLEFQHLFPKIFKGGEAKLEMTEDNLLTTGISVMANPPGKHNRSIHLLSGGEKALTAIALMFAIFRLNPAPFCMLDEVDAPLDDVNIERFGRLIQELSADVQFIVISHNKLTMELVGQLIGVTMRELGVSRLVAVDVDKAVALAELA